MTTTELAAILLWLLPITVAARTVVFAVLTIAMARQRNTTRLDWSILALFVAITFSGMASTYLRWYLYNQSRPEDIDSLIEWSIVISITILPIIESIAGLLVLLWNRELDRSNEPTNQRQDIREVHQNSERESIISQQIELNAQRSGMDEVQTGMNAQQAGMDKRQTAMDAHDAEQKRQDALE